MKIEKTRSKIFISIFKERIFTMKDNEHNVIKTGELIAITTKGFFGTRQHYYLAEDFNLNDKYICVKNSCSKKIIMIRTNNIGSIEVTDGLIVKKQYIL